MKRTHIVSLAIAFMSLLSINVSGQELLDSLDMIVDQIIEGDVIQNVKTEDKKVNDNGTQRILVIGDSTLDGIGRRFNDYASFNGHTIFTSIWYGATTKDWAYTTELDRLLKKVDPTFIVISLGTNDLGYYDFKARAQAVQEILRVIDGIPYIWIGPISLRSVADGSKIVNTIRETVGESNFFDSYHRKMVRFPDGIHPTFEASALWVDDVVKWMSRPEASHHIRLKTPPKSVPFKNYETHRCGYKGRKK